MPQGQLPLERLERITVLAQEELEAQRLGGRVPRRRGRPPRSASSPRCRDRSRRAAGNAGSGRVTPDGGNAAGALTLAGTGIVAAELRIPRPLRPRLGPPPPAARSASSWTGSWAHPASRAQIRSGSYNSVGSVRDGLPGRDQLPGHRHHGPGRERDLPPEGGGGSGAGSGGAPGSSAPNTSPSGPAWTGSCSINVPRGHRDPPGEIHRGCRSSGHRNRRPQRQRDEHPPVDEVRPRLQRPW